MDTTLIGSSFIIWLKDGKYIQVTQEEGAQMTVSQAASHALLVLKDHGINPDQFDRVSDIEELNKKTKAFLFGAACCVAFIAGMAWFIFG